MATTVEKQQPARIDLFSERGRSGLKRHGGILDQEFLRQLKGEKRHRILDEMRFNDPVIVSILLLVDVAVRQVEWRVDPGSNEIDPDQDERVELIDSAMHDMSHSWKAHVSEALSMVPHGWAYHEIVYKRRVGRTDTPGTSSKFSDGRIGWRKLPLRMQQSLDRWGFDEEGGIKGMFQRPSPEFEERFVPIEKALLYRTRHEGNNPEGHSLIRGAFRPWLFKKRIEEYEAIGIERDLTGLPVGRAPARAMRSDAGTDDKAAYNEFKTIIQNVRNDEQSGLILPSTIDEDGNFEWDFELKGSPGTKQIDTDKVIQRYDKRIASSMLSDMTLLGQDRVGSFALASSKTSLFVMFIATLLDAIKTTFNRHAIPRLLELNGMDLEAHPVIGHGDIETLDMEELSKALANLAQAGIVLDLETENFIREKIGLPPRVEEEL